MVVALGGRCGLYGKSVSFRNPLIAAVDGPCLSCFHSSDVVP
jgi:hypothetical protein